jgi:hypothetical protein
MYDSRRCNPRISGVRAYPGLAGMDGRTGHVRCMRDIPGFTGERTGTCMVFIVLTGAWHK